MISISRSRNIFIGLLIFTLVTAPARAQSIPVNTDVADPSMDHITEFMLDYMDTNNVPAAILEIRKKNGDVLLHQGFGWLDEGETEETQPDSMMRILSITKPIVHMAILKMADDSLISLSAKAFCLNSETPSPTGCLLSVTPASGVNGDGIPDANADDITVQHLLDHEAGWDEDIADINGVKEPAGGSAIIADLLSVASPPGIPQLIAYKLDQPLDYTPGTTTAYSNFGYTVLGYIIEQYSNEGDFMEYIYENLTDDLSISRSDMELGAELVAWRNAREPRYVDREANTTTNLFDPNGPSVPWPDGGFLVKEAPGAGGIISTTSALLDYMKAYWLFNPGPRNLLDNGQWTAGGGGSGTTALATQGSPFPGFETEADWVVNVNTNLPENNTLYDELHTRIANTLTKDVAIGDIGGASSSQQFFTLYVPAGQENLEFITSGGSGNINLFVKHGARPTTSDFVCRTLGINGTSQVCSIANPYEGTYYVMIYAYDTFSGVSLKGNYETVNCSVDYNITNNWGSSFQVAVTVTNDGATIIKGYDLVWTLGSGESFSNGWDATFNAAGSVVTATNAATHWNGTINPGGGDVTFHFQAANSSPPPDVISSFALNGVACN